MSGGGNAGGQQRQMGDWSDELRPYWADALSWGKALKDPEGYGAYKAYDAGNWANPNSSRIADLNSTQTGALDAITNFATGSGSPVTQAANGQLQQTLDGNYLTGSMQNPNANAQNPWANVSATVGQNPMLGNLQSGGMFDPFSGAGGGGNQGPMGGQTPGGSGGGSQGPMGGAPGAPGGQQPWQNLISPGSNPYSGTDSPYFQGQLQSALGDITNAYRQGTESNRTRMMNMAGVLGGGADQRQTAIDELGLGRNLSRAANEAYQQQYDRSAGLTEAGLNRSVGTQQFGLNLGSQAFENAAGRGLQTQGLGAGLYESGIGRNLQNSQFDKNLGGQWAQQGLERSNQDFENERQRQMGAVGPGQAEQNLALQRYNSMLGVGDVYRGHAQDLMNQNYQDWQNQQNRQYQMLDMYTGLLNRSQGGMSGNLTTTQTGYNASPLSQVIGAGLLGYGGGRAAGWWG